MASDWADRAEGVGGGGGGGGGKANGPQLASSDSCNCSMGNCNYRVIDNMTDERTEFKRIASAISKLIALKQVFF